MTSYCRYAPLILLLAGGVLGLVSCARIPPQSVDLTETVRLEGQRMHQLNREMLGALFRSKRVAIDSFIQAAFVPTVVEKSLKKAQEQGISVTTRDLPEFITDLMPAVSARRNSLLDALEQQHAKLLKKMDEDYFLYNSACLELKNLLASASQVNASREQAFQRLSGLTNQRIDLNRVEQAMNQFVLKASEKTAVLTDLDAHVKQLDQDIDSLIQPKKP